MKHTHLAFAAVLLTACSAGPQPKEKQREASQGWPRVFQSEKGQLTLHQPQIDRWKNYARLSYKAAVGIQLDGEEAPVVGSVFLESRTSTDVESRVVVLSKHEIQDLRVPGATRGARREYEALLAEVLTKRPIRISIDRVLAGLAWSKAKVRQVRVTKAPPPIYVNRRAAVLVQLEGKPLLRPIKGTALKYVVNTNWDVLFLEHKGRYLLRLGKGWVQTVDLLKGPWTPVEPVPDDLSLLPNTKTWRAARAAFPGQPIHKLRVPEIFVVTRASELIVLEGFEQYSPIRGTNLMYVTNTESDVFLHGVSRKHYFLVSGRWFWSRKLDGPWSAVRKLPVDFAKIPDGHAKAEVKASVPGTAAASEAVLLASVPRKARVSRSEAKVEVVYAGEPRFVRIQGTRVFCAANTPFDVFRCEAKYYVVHRGVWFAGRSPRGSFAVADELPRALYEIPATHAKHHVTYVAVYDSNPEHVVAGYTSGYLGTYVAAGVVVYRTYGAHARYSHSEGTFVRGSPHYGPYRGTGLGGGRSTRPAPVAKRDQGRNNVYVGRDGSVYRYESEDGSWSKKHSGSGWSKTQEDLAHLERARRSRERGDRQSHRYSAPAALSRGRPK